MCHELAVAGAQPQAAAHSFLPSWMGDRLSRLGLRKLVGWEKNSFIRKAKAAHINKQTKKIGINSLISMGRQESQESRVSSWMTVTWGQTPSLWMSLTSSSSPSCYCCMWFHRLWNIPWVSWGRLSSVTPQFFVQPQTPHWWSGVRSKTSLECV